MTASCNNSSASTARHGGEPFRRARYGKQLRRQNPAKRSGNPPGKLAEAELRFTSGALEGLKLIGFAIWERRGGSGRNVTFPARTYSINGERRSYALLRPIDDVNAQERVRALVLDAYASHEERAAIESASIGESSTISRMPPSWWCPGDTIQGE